MKQDPIPFDSAALLLGDGDSVAVARRRLSVGTVLEDDRGGVRLRSDIPAGHKFAVRRVAAGDRVIKYGQMIGYALADISPGDWVHTSNLGFAPAAGSAAREETSLREPPAALRTLVEGERTFQGYRRADGRIGTRNYVALVSTVNCSSSAVQGIADRFRDPAVMLDFPGVDGVLPVLHKTGCGLHLGGQDYDQLQRTLAGIADHPNVAAHMLVGLGCETNQPMALAANRGLLRRDDVAVMPQDVIPPMVIQDIGGVRKTIDRGAEAAVRMLRRASQCARTAQPVGSLLVGTNCGGSDGNSGITANPALGMAGDEFVRRGAGWVLAETTETYGAEHLLTRRAVSQEVADKLLALMRWWEWYTGMWGATIDANPSPGNKEGGLTTIYEKSLGAVAKAGSSALVDVYRYADRITSHGLTFMDTPGHDPVSVTGLAAGGCSIIAFTTGRGSCLGFKPTPVLKIATNTAMYERMGDDMDMNAGSILDGTPMADVAIEIFERLISVASGERTKSELQGFGDLEFAPWTLGPVM